jgi:tRNA(adenine34) deaminase
MLFSEEVYKYMFAALTEAEKALEDTEVPVGAVIVHKNRIIGKGFNQVEKLKDPTAHAEMIAITAAANKLQDWNLNECALYVTVEPCVMCTGAVIASRINTIYFSIFEPKFGACGSLYNIAEDKKLNHSIKTYSGIYAEESTRLMREFFLRIRAKNN